MARIAYYRCSSADQSIDAQRTALGGEFDKEFSDDAISGAVLARQRPGFAALLDYVREGDEVRVFAVDRLGRDAIDVQQTVRDFRAKGIAIDIRGLGRLDGPAGDLILAVLAQVAQMERDRIRERCEAGRLAARLALEATGLTHRGKASLGRPRGVDPAAVYRWRRENNASISATASHFGISAATVKRAGRLAIAE